MKIIINRTDAIGDLILTLPMVPFIKETYPDSKIHFIVSPRNAQLMDFAELVDDYTVYDNSLNIFKRLKVIYEAFKKINPDTYIYVGGSHAVSFIAWFLRVTNRGGLISRLPSFIFLNKGIRQPRRLAVMHESEYNLNLLSAFNFEYDYKNKQKYYPRIKIPENLENEVLQFLKPKINIDQYIVIHPGMTGHTLNWPIKSYARLIRLLFEKYNDKFTYIISYTPADLPVINEIKEYFNNSSYKNVSESIFYYDGSVKGLGYYMALIKNAKYFIGPSTGPTHLASLLKVPLTALFSPIKTQSALRWGPYYQNNFNSVIVPEVVCGEENKCSKEKCPYYECMGKIEVDDVILKITTSIGT